MPDRPWRIEESVVFAALTDAVAVVDVHGELLQTNPAWQKIFGNDAVDTAQITREWDWFSSDGESLALADGPFSAPAGSRSVGDHTILGCRGKEDTEISWFHVNRTPLLNPSGTSSRHVVTLAVAADFTRHLHTSQILAEAAREFRGLTDVAAITKQITSYAVRLTDFDTEQPRRSSLIHIDPTYEIARVLSDHDDADPSLSGVTFALRDHPWIETTVRTGLPLRAELDVDLLGPTVRPYNEGIGLTHAGYVPIMVDDTVYAVLTIGSRKGDGISTLDLENTSALCEIASLALSRAQLVQTILEQTLTDPLTGLPNRSGFERRTADLPRVPYAVMAIEIDDLAHVNARHGQEAGDELIRLVANTISAQLRRGDVVARTGGGALLAVFVNAFQTEMAVFADRIVSALHQISFAGRSTRVSVGCAGGAPQSPPEMVIAAAGAALGRARQRSRVSVEIESSVVEAALAGREESVLRHST